MNAEEESKVNKLLETIKTEVVEGTSMPPSKDGYCANEHCRQMTNVANNMDSGNNHREHTITNGMGNGCYIKKEKDDYPDYTGEKSSYKWLKVEKSEDVECMIPTHGPSSEVGCGSEYNEQAIPELNGFWNERVGDEHVDYNRAKIMKYNSDIKEVKIDSDGFVLDSDEYPPQPEVTYGSGAEPSESIPSYLCTLCEYRGTTKKVLLKHFKVKHDEDAEWHQCQLCEYRTKIKTSLTRHFIGKHDDSAEWYQCQCCEFRTKTKCNLKRHFINTHDTSAAWYQCHICEFKTKITAVLRGHYKRKHASTTEWHRCELCESIFKDKTYLKTHYKMKHSENVEWHHCKACTFKTKNKKSLDLHFKYKHDNTTKWHKCKVCKFKTKYGSYLKQHFQAKHGNS